jgi:Zn-dependent peptidase ImmA (M78 family)
VTAFDQPDAPDQATIQVRFEDAAGPFHGLYDDKTGTVYINQGIANRAVLAVVVAHELGHAFGLHHVPTDDRTSLMNPGNLATPPTLEDELAVEAIWGACK